MSNVWNTVVNGYAIEFALNTPFKDDDEETAVIRAERLAEGTLIQLITAVPENADGSYKNVWFPDFKDQGIKSAMTGLHYALYSALTGDPLVQTYDERDDDARRYGRMGWIHFTALDRSKSVTNVTFAKKVKEGRKTVTKHFPAIVHNIMEWDDQFQTFVVQKTIESEWLRMIKQTDFTWTLDKDDTIDKRSGQGWGSLLASNRLALHQGTTYRISPVVWGWVAQSGENAGETIVKDQAQKSAQRLMVALQAIDKGEITVEEAGRQFFQDRLFMRISYQNKDEADSLPEETTEKLVENAQAVKEGTPVKDIGLTVTVDGKSYDIASLPKGNYVAKVDGNAKVRYHENHSFNGRKRLANAVQQYGDRLTVEKAQGNLS